MAECRVIQVMDIIRLIASCILFIAILYLINKLGKNPTPLLRSEKPKKDLIEVGVFTLIVALYLTLKIFVLNPIGFSFSISIGMSTIIFLIIPLMYTRYRDQWTWKDFGINSKVKNWYVVIASIIYFTLLGFQIIVETSWYFLIIFFYSNVFLEEFLFRGVIQSKIEKALGQNKAVFLQGVLFMLIHAPKYIQEFSVEGDFAWFLSRFILQFFNGYLFGLIYLKTRNLWISVICHYLNNFIGAIIYIIV